jgi:hypothetical protein
VAGRRPEVNALRSIGAFFAGIPRYLWLGLAAVMATIVILWRVAVGKAGRAEKRAEEAEAGRYAATASRDRVVDLVKAEVRLEAAAATERKRIDAEMRAVVEKTEALKVESRKRAEEIARADDEALADLLNARRVEP